jgi:hypothetical protein
MPPPADLTLVSKDHNLRAWKNDWLMDGDLLICRYCNVAQPIHLASSPFIHIAPCDPVDRPPQFPWQELADIIKGMLKAGNV